jgi:hypothetical protein
MTTATLESRVLRLNERGHVFVLADDTASRYPQRRCPPGWPWNAGPSPVPFSRSAPTTTVPDRPYSLTISGKLSIPYL